MSDSGGWWVYDLLATAARASAYATKFPIAGRLHKWWGGRVGLLRAEASDFAGEKRVQGDPRGPGVRPTIYQDSQIWENFAALRTSACASVYFSS